VLFPCASQLSRARTLLHSGATYSFSPETSSNVPSCATGTQRSQTAPASSTQTPSVKLESSNSMQRLELEPSRTKNREEKESAERSSRRNRTPRSQSSSSMVMLFDCFAFKFRGAMQHRLLWIFYRESEASFAHLLGAHVHHCDRPIPTRLFEHLLHRSPHQSCSATLADQVQAWLWHTADTRTKRTWPGLVSCSSSRW